MLDERTSRLLSAINESCASGSYKLMEESELLCCFPKTMRVDGDCLKAMLAYLEEHKYIEVGYAEEGEYCLRPLPEGRLYFEQSKSDRRQRIYRRIEAFLLALLGGVTGGFLGAGKRSDACGLFAVAG